MLETKGAHLLLAEAIHLFNVSCILLSSEAERKFTTIPTTITRGCKMRANISSRCRCRVCL